MRNFLILVLLACSVPAFACGPVGKIVPKKSGILHIYFPGGEGFNYVNDDTGMVAAMTVIAHCNEPYVSADVRWNFGKEKLACAKTPDALAILAKATERYRTYSNEMERLGPKLKSIWGLDGGDDGGQTDNLIKMYRDSAKAKADLLEEFNDNLKAGDMTGKEFSEWFGRMEKYLNPEDGYTESYFVAIKEEDLPGQYEAGNESRSIWDLSSSTGMTMPNAEFVSQCRDVIDAEYLAPIAKSLKNWVTTPGTETSLDPDDAKAGAGR